MLTNNKCQQNWATVSKCQPMLTDDDDNKYKMLTNVKSCGYEGQGGGQVVCGWCVSALRLSCVSKMNEPRL